jgi:hypothetical protein
VRARASDSPLGCNAQPKKSEKGPKTLKSSGNLGSMNTMGFDQNIDVGQRVRQWATMNYTEATLVALTPCNPSWNAVYAGDLGEPEFEPIACWGTYQLNARDFVVAMVRSTSNAATLQPADLDPMFVGIAVPGEDLSAWEDACQEHFDEMTHDSDDEYGDEEDDEDDIDEEDDVEDGEYASFEPVAVVELEPEDSR